MPTSSSARLTSQASTSNARNGLASSRQHSGPKTPSSSSSSRKASSKSKNNDNSPSRPPLATAEIIEKATMPLNGLSARDALTVWKALGLYLGEQLIKRRRVISIERFGVFGYNDANEAVFLHSSEFLQSNRLKEIVASQGLKGQPALAACANPMSKINTIEISQEYLQNCGRDVVYKVVTHVIAYIGKLAKQGRGLRLGFAPLGEWSCTGEKAEFNFLPVFQQQMAESAAIDKMVEALTPAKKNVRTPEEMRARGQSSYEEERRESELAFTAQALEDHTAKVNSTNQKSHASSQHQSQKTSSSSRTSGSRRLGWSKTDTHESQAKPRNRKPPATPDRRSDSPTGGIVGRVRNKILGRCGDRGLNALQRVLSLLDTSGDGVLSAQELKFGLRDLGVELSPSELRAVVASFDRNGDGVVSLDELLYTLRGHLSGKRRRWIEKAFDCMDRTGCGVVSLDDLRENYDVSLLPRVRAGKKSKVQAMNEFVREWATSVEHNNAIPRNAFVEYYHNVSAGIADDSDFELLMRQTWHVSPTDSEPESDEEEEEDDKCEEIRSTRTVPLSRQRDENVQQQADSKKTVNVTLEDEWKYLRSVLLPPRVGVHTLPTLDDICRRLGVNRVWGDGNETMNTRAFANALGRLDRQLHSKDAQHLTHVVAQCCDASRGDMIPLAAVYQLLMSSQPIRIESSVASGHPSINGLGMVDRVRTRLLQRLQAQTHDQGEPGVPAFLGLHALQRTLRLLDSNKDKRLTKEELKIGLRKIGVEINLHELDQLFTCLDADRSGCIDMDEFLVAMRGGDEALTKNPRRLALVHTAFDILDRGRDGSVTLDELSQAYDTSKHPDVLAGRMTAEEALRQFAQQWDTLDKDGIITRQEFEVYYRNVSALIDSDDYFELMMRNAWHISGGVGHSANTSNRRVLVTKADGSQSVQEIKNDLGIRAADRGRIHENLRAQGVDAMEFATTGYVEDKNNNQSIATRKPWRREQRENQPQTKPVPKKTALAQPKLGRGKTNETTAYGREAVGASVAPSDFFPSTAGLSAYPGDVYQRRQDQRQRRERAALLIQSQFRGFRCRKFVDCVRRHLAAELLRQQRAEEDEAPRKRVLTRAALKSYYGF